MMKSVRGVWKKLPVWGKIVFGGLFLVVAVQFLYPSDRVLPLARLDGDYRAFELRGNVESWLVNAYDNVTVTTTVNGKTDSVLAQDAGIQPDIARITEGLIDYPWYLRLIPFSLLAKGALTDQAVIAVADGDGFEPFVNSRIEACAQSPKNASVRIEGGEVVIDHAADGTACSPESIRSQVLAIPLSQKRPLQVNLKTTAVKPTRSDADIAPLLKQAKQISAYTLQLDVVGTVTVVDKAQVVSWLTFPENAETKKIDVSIDDEAVKKYLATIQKNTYVAPGTTVIYTQDSLETSRVVGANGRGINLETTAAKIHEQLLKSSGKVTADITVLAPKVQYVRTYSNTPAGLQALVNDLVAGKDMAISVRRLGDTGVHANGDKQYHPASTYKLFVAYSVLKRIDGGGIGWDQPATNGQTVGQCFDNMIVNSDNACAEWFGGVKVGWAAVEGDARAIGASRTSFTKTKTFLSTTNDLALLLQKLESNQLGLSENSRSRLLNAMSRQRYRQGIPAGVGVAVADKVGFLEAKLHDAGIVYAPSGVYVLVVMSDGSSWAAIADVANQINKQMSSS